MIIKELIKELRKYDKNYKVMIGYEGVTGEALFVEQASRVLDGKKINAVIIEGTE